jgi:hypothetical protein
MVQQALQQLLGSNAAEYLSSLPNGWSADAYTTTPLPTDWQNIYQGIVKTFVELPNALDPIVDKIIPLDVNDGKPTFTFPTIAGGGDASYSMTIQRSETSIKGGTITINTPQVIKSSYISVDEMNVTFANQNRYPPTMTMVQRIVREGRMKKAFQGDAALDLQGLTGTDSHSVSTAGAWAKNATTGLVDNAITDINEVMDHVYTADLGDHRVDCVLPVNCYRKLLTSMPTYEPRTTNLEIVSPLLNGGHIYFSNYLTAAKTTGLFVVRALNRDDISDCPFVLLESGQQILNHRDLTGMEFLLRQKVATKVLNSTRVYIIPSMSVA